MRPAPPTPDLRVLVPLVAAGGVVGALGRWALTSALPSVPATAVANLSGCLLLGLLVGYVADGPPGRGWARPFWGTGVLGGYTTFSTLAVSVAQTGRAHPGRAAALVFGSVVGGVLLAAVGLRAGRASRHRAA